jgi:dolichyl-phosphate-mannose--protein O-mannosyl transferase
MASCRLQVYVMLTYALYWIKVSSVICFRNDLVWAVWLRCSIGQSFTKKKGDRYSNDRPFLMKYLV